MVNGQRTQRQTGALKIEDPDQNGSVALGYWQIRDHGLSGIRRGINVLASG